MIEKDIPTADLGLNPTNDGRSGRVKYAPTEERAETLVKSSTKCWRENQPHAVRNVTPRQQEAIEKVEKKDKKIQPKNDKEARLGRMGTSVSHAETKKIADASARKNAK